MARELIDEWVQDLRSLHREMGQQLADEIYIKKAAPDGMLRNASVVIAGVISALRRRDADTLAEWAAPTRAYVRKHPKPSSELESLFVLERSQVLRELRQLYAMDVHDLKKLKLNGDGRLAEEIVKRACLLVEHILDYEPNRLPFLEPASRKSASSAGNVLPPDHDDVARVELAVKKIVAATRKALADNDDDNDAAESALKAAFSGLGLGKVKDLFSFEQKASKREAQ